MEFHGKHVLHRRRRMHRRHERDRAFRHVDCRCHAVLLAQCAHLLHLAESPHRKQIGMHHVYARLHHLFEIIRKINVFARAKRHAAVLCEFFQMLRLLPRRKIFHPRDIVLFEPARKPDRVFDRHMPEMIDRKRHFVTDHVAHLLHVVFKIIKPLFRDMYARSIVRNRENLIIFAEHQRFIDAARLMANGFHIVLLEIFHHAERRVERAGFVVQKLDAEIHFQKRETLRHALFQGVAHVCTRVLAVYVGIAVNAHLVAPFAAEQLIHRHAVKLADNIVKRHFHARYAAALTGMSAELFDSFEQFFYVERVFADEAAFEHFRIRCARRVAHFAVTHDVAVCVDFE